MSTIFKVEHFAELCASGRTLEHLALLDLLSLGCGVLAGSLLLPP